ncbi:MAG: hypothetical protein HC868_09595, partial [Sphingomonadales bacterium]|nr:hypothetical protein [Sphingomonadales bacterium]
MTRQLAKPQPLYARFGDAFVILSVTLLSLASGAWLITSLGLELTSAMLTSLAIYSILLLLHLLVRRSLADAEDDDEDELLYGDSHWQTAQLGEPFEAALVRTSANSAPAAKSGGRPPSRSQPGVWPEPLPMPTAAGLGADQGPPESDPFTFRPSRTPYLADASDFDPHALGAAPGKEQAPEASLLPPEMPEVNVEYIQELIKKLADELNGDVAASREPGARRCDCAG